MRAEAGWIAWVWKGTNVLTTWKLLLDLETTVPSQLPVAKLVFAVTSAIVHFFVIWCLFFKQRKNKFLFRSDLQYVNSALAHIISSRAQVYVKNARVL